MRRALLIALAIATCACTRAEIVERDGSAPDGSLRDAAALDGGVADGAVDAATDAGCPREAVDTEGQPAGCVLRRPPGRPLCDAPTTAPELVFALRSIELHVGVEVGLDVDGYCTEDITGPASCEPESNHAIDRAEGIDNAFEDFIDALEFAYRAGVGGELSADIDGSLERGIGNPTIRLSGWNGRSDDQNVEVAIASAACAAPAGATTCTPGEAATLDWDRVDNVFFPEASAFVAGDIAMPRIVDGTAYMSDDTLVARLPDGAGFPLGTPDGPIVVSLNDAYLVARLAPDRSGWAMGFVAGKWPRASAESAAEPFGVCPGTPAHGPLARTIQAALDVVANGPGGAGVPCDALSVAIGFTAQLASWGPLTASPPPVDGCP